MSPLTSPCFYNLVMSNNSTSQQEDPNHPSQDSTSLRDIDKVLSWKLRMAWMVALAISRPITPCFASPKFTIKRARPILPSAYLKTVLQRIQQIRLRRGHSLAENRVFGARSYLGRTSRCLGESWWGVVSAVDFPQQHRCRHICLLRYLPSPTNTHLLH